MCEVSQVRAIEKAVCFIRRDINQLGLETQHRIYANQDVTNIYLARLFLGLPKGWQISVSVCAIGEDINSKNNIEPFIDQSMRFDYTQLIAHI